MSQNTQPLLLDPAGLAKALGLNIKTIYNRIASRGDLPRITRLSRGTPRFLVDDVRDWLAEKREPRRAKAEADLPPPRRPGRPTKAEQITRRKAVTVGGVR